MTSHKVIWSDKSLNDLELAYDFLAEKSQIAANQMIDEVFERVTQLEHYPLSGPVESLLSHLKKEYRYLVSGHFKIIYRIEPGSVFIVRFFDTRQDPDNMQKRKY